MHAWVVRGAIAQKSRIAALVLLAAAFTAGQAALAQPAPVAESARFHHVHLNVTDPATTMRFYQRVFGAVPVKFMGRADALFTERSFILMTKVAATPPAEIKSGIWHIGWGGVDVPNEYQWWKAHGAKIHTELYQLGNGWVTYLDGPDGERIEINTQGHHRFAHVHLLAADPNKTARWYADNLGLALRRREVPRPADLTKVRAWSNAFNCDNVNFVVYHQPNYDPVPPWWDQKPLLAFETSEGRAIDHFAFSFRDLDAALARMKAAGVQIVRPIAVRPEDGGLKSFFVRAPDGVLVEIVQSKPIPEGVWEEGE